MQASRSPWSATFHQNTSEIINATLVWSHCFAARQAGRTPPRLPTSWGACVEVQKRQEKRLRKPTDKFFPARLILKFFISVIQPTLLCEEEVHGSTSWASYTQWIQIPLTALRLQLGKQLHLQALQQHRIQKSGSQENPHTETNQFYRSFSQNVLLLPQIIRIHTAIASQAALMLSAMAEVLLSLVSELLKQARFSTKTDTRRFKHARHRGEHSKITREFNSQTNLFNTVC